MRNQQYESDFYISMYILCTEEYHECITNIISACIVYRCHIYAANVWLYSLYILFQAYRIILRIFFNRNRANRNNCTILSHTQSSRSEDALCTVQLYFTGQQVTVLTCVYSQLKLRRGANHGRNFQRNNVELNLLTVLRITCFPINVPPFISHLITPRQPVENIPPFY